MKRLMMAALMIAVSAPALAQTIATVPPVIAIVCATVGADAAISSAAIKRFT